MKDGTYRYAIEMTVPLGKRNGRLELVIQNPVVTGSLTMFTNTLPITQGSCKGGRIRFTGIMENLLHQIAYTAEGRIRPSGIELSFQTDRGCYPAVGRQPVAAWRGGRNT